MRWCLDRYVVYLNFFQHIHKFFHALIIFFFLVFRLSALFLVLRTALCCTSRKGAGRLGDGCSEAAERSSRMWARLTGFRTSTWPTTLIRQWRMSRIARRMRRSLSWFLPHRVWTRPGICGVRTFLPFLRLISIRQTRGARGTRGTLPISDRRDRSHQLVPRHLRRLLLPRGRRRRG